MAYPLHRSELTDVPARVSFPALEHDVLAYWGKDQTFQASIDQRLEDPEFVFYDGPPFANGLPHYGHLLTGYVKDVAPRYRTMLGRRVERRFGWDCHGLPAEIEAERELGIKNKSEIDAMGVAEFNAACRASVLRYTDQWEDYVSRQARWVDFANDYKTLDLPYMESVMWAFKTLWDKGLIYEGRQVLWYCFRCGTPLSASETRMDEVYRPRQDAAVTVAFRLDIAQTEGPPADAVGSAPGSRPTNVVAKLGQAAAEAGSDVGVVALAWTTTPWTLPSNLALAVNPEVDYVLVGPKEPNKIRKDDLPLDSRQALVGWPMPRRLVLLAEARLGAYARELGETPDVIGRFRGSELVGLRYRPLFDFFSDHADQGAFTVLAADYVTTEDGTGLVHIAPAYGEEDKIVTDSAGIDLVNPVDAAGRFTAPVTPWQGMNVFDANKPIIQALKESRQLLRQETYDHPYPHCWRCDTPLIQYAVSSWFVAVTRFRDRMVELNQQIEWLPEHVRDGQFGKWLEGARDWSISRNRYWGSPIPVWVSDDPAHPRIDVYGSLDELERDFGVRPTDLHRPAIDQLTRPNPDHPGATMRRVPEVLDCWFESGSMPFAQVHYPFENREWFETHYPGDFIVEYIGQTRGWFYTLHVLATALFDKPSFRTCLTHGIVLGDDGLKMSKSKGNFPDVRTIFERDGADAMRWFLMSGAILRGGNLVVTDDAIRDAVRQVLLPLWNTWSFFGLYANSANGGAGLRGRRVTAADYARLGELDRYILARTRTLVEDLTAQLDQYLIPEACESVREFLDALNNWYVRESRDRFWAEEADAFNVLWTVLETLTRLTAPLLPLLSEEIWRGLTAGRSVHLCDWPSLETGTPDAAALVADAALVAVMERVREVCSAALSMRKAHGMKVRQPLASLVVADSSSARLAPFVDLIKAEVNVKRVELVEYSPEAATRHGVYTRLEVNARAAGPRLGRGVQAVIKAVKSGAWQRRGDGAVVVTTPDGEVPLLEGEYTTRTVVEDREGDQLGAAVLSGNGFALLDLKVNDALLAEGYARDMVRLVQDERKASGLHVADRIALSLSVPAPWVAAVRAHADMIQRETLARSLAIDTSPTDVAAAQVAKLT
ncbi:MAG: isoleucine--tRNA ligase [Bifidobacteriaceae bacterium]|jgi:isoleucyl-tRNA synthetase|nr:isoleucine--tRNA ligase [Bifidobacteriaceae bacterium]